jgi:signal transduction histidine kinase
LSFLIASHRKKKSTNSISSIFVLLLINFYKEASEQKVSKTLESDAFLFSTYMAKYIFLVICLIGLKCNDLHAQFIIKEKLIDSVEAQSLRDNLKQLSTNEQLKTYPQLLNWYIENEKDSLLYHYSQAFAKLANSNGNSIQKAEALYFAGYATRNDNKSEALEKLTVALQELERDKSSLLKDIYYQISIFNLDFSEFPSALEFALKSLEYNRQTNNQVKLLRDLSHLGYIHDRMYEFETSIDYNRKALKIAQQINNKEGEAICYGRIGIAYDELAERDNFNQRLFDSALHYNLNAAKIAETYHMPGFARTTYSNIGNTYSKLKNFEKAEEYTLKSLSVPGFEPKKGVTLVNLGKIYLETGRYEAARKVLDSAMNNTIKYGTRKYQLEAFYRFHELDLKLGNYKSALQNYVSYKKIEDALLNETKTRQIAEMSERFKTAEKEREILIQRAELAEKNLIIQNRNIQLYTLLAIALMAILVGYLFYSQQKLKNRQLQKENELKDALIKIETQNRLQEQRLRISRDLHDNIGAQLTFIISSLDNLKYGFDLSDNLQQKLSQISQFTTSTIYELRDTIWAMNKSEISVEDLQSRLSNFVDKARSSCQVEFEFITDTDSDISFSSVEGMNIYRIVQEAVNNAIKYAEANSIVVHFTAVGKKVAVKVQDNGKGFDIEKVNTGNGLLNMKKRASEINGHLEINSNLETGTQIKLMFQQ